MVTLINQINRHEHERLLASMHADRKSVFVDRLGWDVPHDDRGEYDAFDHDATQYFIVRDPATGVHQASLRLLATEGEHMMNTLFPHLVDGAVPAGGSIREISRMCVSPRLAPGRSVATFNRLATSLVEHALHNGLEGYTLVANMAGLRQVRSVGWECHMLGLPRQHDGERIGAMMIDINPETIRLLRLSNRWCPGMVTTPGTELTLAA